MQSASLLFRAMPMRVAVCISGRGSNLRALVEALPASAPARIAVVISNRADAPGLKYARDRRIPAAVLADAADPSEWLRILQQHRAELIVLAGYVKLVPAPVVAAYRDRILNIHPALLPEFGGPGMYGLLVHQAVLRSGQRVSGATVHLVDEVYDRGRVLGQARVPVEPGDTPESLAARVLVAEHRLLPAAVLAAAEAGRPVPFLDPMEIHS